MADSNRKKKTGSSGRTGNAGKGKAQNKRNRQQEAEQELGFMRAEVVVICSFAVSLLLFLSNFNLCGAVGRILRSVQLGLFGLAGFPLPLMIFFGTCFYLSNRGDLRPMMKLGAGILAVLVACGIIQLIFGVLPAGSSWSAYYTQSSVNGQGGGWIGGVLAAVLTIAIGRIGAWLVLLVLLALCIVCITERSLVSAVKSGSGKAYQYAREDMDRRREDRARRQEEKQNARDQKVWGVNLNATTLEAPSPADLPDVMAEFVDAVPAKAKKEDAPEPQSSETNEAAVFKGNIQLPPEYPEAESEEPAVAYLLHKHEEDQWMKAPREHRTLRELEMDLPPFETDQMEAEPVSAPAPAFQPVDEIVGQTAPDEQEIPIEEPEQGINYDSIFVPDEEVEERQIVTASGKVIETESELLQKKIEKKKQEAAQEQANLQVAQEIQQKEEAVKKEYIFPPTSLLKRSSRTNGGFSEEQYKATAIKLQQTLHNFGVGVTVTNISCGPAVTRYELLPEQGVKVSKIVSLSDDIKLSLAAADIRIEAPIPGKSAVGIEVPNKENNVVYLRELLESENFKTHKSRLAFAVGKDIGGQTVVTDISKMPHLLIAGATGSGKSVCINTLIMSVIYKAKPEEVRLIMIDPKVVELSVYNGIPHLLIPVVTDPKKASGALSWAVAEMTQRYQKFAQCNVRDMKGYNDRIDKLKDIPEGEKPEKLPQIVIIIDELADLMMVAPGEVEESICRLAQLARAAGIHLVIATQRPSVNVITGLIKANIPSRIAFAVSSGVDSRTIIDMYGAEKLLGKGDMLFYPAGFPKPQRVQGAFVSDEEVGRVVEFLTDQGMTASYSSEVETQIQAGPALESGAAARASQRDEYFVQAGQLIIDKEKASIGMLQRMFKIGFNRAARIMDQLAEAGVVGEEEGTKPRKILMSPEEFQEFLRQDQS